MKCSFCGNDNRDGAQFCRVCGKPLQSSAAPVPTDKPEPSDTSDQSALAQALPTPIASDEQAAALDQQVQSATPAAPAAQPTELAPLAPGAELKDKRFVVVDVISTTDDLNVYRVRDRFACPTCFAENTPDDKYCINCGRELNEHPTISLEERRAPSDVTSVAPPSFVANGRVYAPKEEKPADTQPTRFPFGVHLSFAMRSDAGVERSGAPDEDSIFGLATSAMYESMARPTVGLFIVADGVGGSEAGEVASKKGIEVISSELLNHIVLPVLAGNDMDNMAVRAQIEEAILKANTAVFELAKEKQNDMGSTITLALVIDDSAFIANVGDSRTYLFDGGTLQQITHDHSLIASLIANNMAQPEEIYTHPKRNMIFRSLGGKPEVAVDIFPQQGGALKLNPGSRLVLCCDGLWEMLHSEGIEEMLLQPESDLQKLCDKLVARANEAGGEDNISVVIVSVEG